MKVLQKEVMEDNMKEQATGQLHDFQLNTPPCRHLGTLLDPPCGLLGEGVSYKKSFFVWGRAGAPPCY